jgi:hypothetical protein
MLGHPIKRLTFVGILSTGSPTLSARRRNTELEFAQPKGLCMQRRQGQFSRFCPCPPVSAVGQRWDHYQRANKAGGGVSRAETPSSRDGSEVGRRMMVILDSIIVGVWLVTFVRCAQYGRAGADGDEVLPGPARAPGADQAAPQCQHCFGPSALAHAVESTRPRPLAPSLGQRRGDDMPQQSSTSTPRLQSQDGYTRACGGHFFRQYPKTGRQRVPNSR